MNLLVDGKITWGLIEQARQKQERKAVLRRLKLVGGGGVKTRRTQEASSVANFQAIGSQRKLRARPRPVTCLLSLRPEGQEGRLRRDCLWKPNLYASGSSAPFRNAAPPSIGERGADFGKTGRKIALETRSALKVYLPLPSPAWGSEQRADFHSSTIFNHE